MRRVHPISVAILVGGLAVVAAATVVTEVLHRDTEQRLLDQRTAEAGALLSSSISSGIQTPLASAVELAQATDGDPAAFRAVLGTLTGPAPRRFRSAALYRVGATEPELTIGEPAAIAPDDVAAMQEQALAPRESPTDSPVSVVDLLDQPDRRLGYAVASAQGPRDFVVYVETALPSRVARTAGPFEDVDYATYLGPGSEADELIFASVEDLPLEGRTSQAVVDFGDDHLTLVFATTSALGGTLSGLVPWLVAIIGTAIVVGAAVMAERLVRRRGEAETLAGDVSRLYEDQRHRTETLQQSLLPRELPQPPGVTVAARYWPADVTSEIGGDFYDLFGLGGGRWGVTIGDVCGKGIEAAALTGVTRHTIRAAARHVTSSADVLRWTYEAINAYSDETYATVCFAFLDLSGPQAELEVALGGHPGPVRCQADGTVEVLGQRGTVLGLVEPRVTATRYSLAQGDTVVFYTDGITDAPGAEAISVGELEDAIRGAAAQGPGATANAIRAAVEGRRPGGSKDDTAILVLRIVGRTASPASEPAVTASR